MRFIKIFQKVKNNKGMTYVELVIALALLMLIVTTFSPMLLNSYNALYEAGELNEKTYGAKTELEEGLATRDSVYTKTLSAQFEGVSQALKVNLRGVVSDLQDSFQTLFYGGKGYLKIVSPKVIRDDYSIKEVAFQITGMYIPSESNIKINEGQSSAKVEEIEITENGIKRKQKVYTVAVKMFLPDFDNGNNEETGFSDNSLAEIKTVSLKADPNSKNSKNTITLTFDGADVTDSVVKIVVYYKDENGEEKEISGFIQIDAPTLMFVGETTHSESNGEKAGVTPAYYTSAGFDNDKLKIEARPMTAKAAEKYPAKTVFNTIEYVTNDNTGYFNPYYVIVGNQGTIQRLYLGSKNGIEGYNKISGRTDKGNPVTGFSYKDGTVLKMAFPTLWGGDKSHQFGLSTYGEVSGYHNDKYQGIWYTGNKDGTEKPEYDVYDNQASYSLYFNGSGMTAKEAMRNARTISYTLTEYGYAIRLVGEKDGTNWGGFITSWESANNEIRNNKWNGAGTLKAVNPNSGKREYHTDPKPLRVNDPCNVQDSMFSMIMLKNYCSTNLKDLLKLWGGKGEEKQNKRLADNPESHNIDITAAVFNPQLGEMLYLGTSNAYGLIQQVDASQSNYNAHQEYSFYFNQNGRIKRDALTAYLIEGDAVSGTQVYKISSHRDGKPDGPETNINNTIMKSLRTVKGIETYNNCANTIVEKTNPTAFFVDRSYAYSEDLEGSGKADNTSNTVWQLDMKDFNFHLGYSSNRTNVYTEIVFGGPDKKEHHKSYEKYFFLSHYGDALGPTGRYSDNDKFWVRDAQTQTTDKYRNPMHNNMLNDMYNVWFPGEFYSLISSATKDGITVAVGYTAAGSSFQRVREGTNNTSTSLGGLYNDGVMAIMTGENENFQNILYYKDYEKFDSTSITDDSTKNDFRYGSTTVDGVVTKTTPQTYKDVYGRYGTHSRESIHFLCVDIATHSTKESVTINGTATEREKETTYYAVYGDDRGRAFVSKIATKENASAGSSNALPTVVEGIRDLYSTENTSFYPTASDKNFGHMREIYVTVGTEKHRLDEYFSEINVITAHDDIVIISGIARGAVGTYIAVGKITGEDTTESGWKIIKVASTPGYDIEDMLVMDGIVYFVGQYTGTKRTDNTNRGFIACMNYSDLESAITSTAGHAENWGVEIDKCIIGVQMTNNAIYSIAGRGQNAGMEAEEEST